MYTDAMDKNNSGMTLQPLVILHFKKKGVAILKNNVPYQKRKVTFLMLLIQYPQ